MDNLRNKLKKINISGDLRFDEPMSLHTTFKTGGPADVYISPADSGELVEILKFLRRSDIPVFIMGAGANLLVSDRGIRGAVVDTSGLSAITISGSSVICEAGVMMDEAAEAALAAGLGGFDAFYGMPGTVGGAVWMNARCYGVSISDIIVFVEYLDESLNPCKSDYSGVDFEYKKSPFQTMNSIILKAGFELASKNRTEIKRVMDENKTDRTRKGHYAGPSAGSVFKNNRDFGRPSGAIIDSLGLRGMQAGGAKISDSHANIFINTGDASSADIYRLIMTVKDRVRDAFGFELEAEIQFIGDFTNIT